MHAIQLLLVYIVGLRQVLCFALVVPQLALSVLTHIHTYIYIHTYMHLTYLQNNGVDWSGLAFFKTRDKDLHFVSAIGKVYSVLLNVQGALLGMMYCS